jgi:hypothetical protein
MKRTLATLVVSSRRSAIISVRKAMDEDGMCNPVRTLDGFTCLPVRPQIPTFSPCLMLTETSRNAGIFSLFDS